MRTRSSNTLLLLMCLLLVTITASCNKDTQPTVQVSAQVTPPKHYPLKGKVVSIDKQSKMLNVDSEAIPDFMNAMTMPYKVKPDSELDKLSPGDAITADVVVQEDKAWLENIAVINRSAAPASK